MKVLFLASDSEDYLSDGLLCGLRQLYGSDCVDYPKAEHMYEGFNPTQRYSLYGRGFTLYSGLFEDVYVDRYKVGIKLKDDFYDLVIFGNIWSQYGLFAQYRHSLDPGKTIILDGADSPQVYPYAGVWWRRFSQWFMPRAHKSFLYFKREWTSDSQFNFWHRLIPSALRKYLPAEKNLKQISFSIPKEKILKGLPEKTKDFAVHCVDPEVAERIPVCRTSYAFNNEEEYYADLQASRFAITTKRAGWDCLRHYEIAANGCIPCFRDLDKKPVTCAPHGLNRSNCIIYHSAEDLLNQVENISLDQELSIRKQALRWARKHTCGTVAQGILSQIILSPS